MTLRRDALFLAAGLFISYAYFYQAGGWNQNSRFALVRAIVEHGTLRVDETAVWNGQGVTRDLAHRGIHVYSDKAPGLALTAVPFVAIARPFVAEPESKAGIATLSYLATLVTAALPTVVAAVLVAWLALQFGATRGAAFFAALVFGVGTPAWAYATLFFGHALATGCLVAAFAAATALREFRSPRRDWLLAAGVGVAAGWATVTEFPTAVPAAIVAILAMVNAWPAGVERRRRVFAGVTAGALACVAALMLHNQAAFGAPLGLGYERLEGFPGMQQGFLGITYPKAGVLVELLFGRYRGILLLAPVLVLAPWGLTHLIRAPETRSAGIAATTIVVYYLLFNAAYFYWTGGWSYGPRHMAPALPFVSLALAPFWARATTRMRPLLGVVACCGALLSLMAVSVTAQPPESYPRPVSQLLWPSFRSGDLSLNHQSFVEPEPTRARDPAAHAWNLGERLGLTGKASLVPLLLAWGALGAAWWFPRRGARRRELTS